MAAHGTPVGSAAYPSSEEASPSLEQDEEDEESLDTDELKDNYMDSLYELKIAMDHCTTLLHYLEPLLAQHGVSRDDMFQHIKENAPDDPDFLLSMIPEPAPPDLD